MNAAKYFIALLLVAACPLFAGPASGQQGNTAPTLEIGKLRVHLGMTQAELGEKLVKLGYEVIRLPENTWHIDPSDSVYMAIVSFDSKGKLIYAERSWVVKTKSIQLENPLLDAILEAFNSVVSTPQLCTVSYDATVSGGSISVVKNQVWIRCGQRGVRIVKTRAGTVASTAIDVTETIQ